MKNRIILALALVALNASAQDDSDLLEGTVTLNGNTYSVKADTNINTGRKVSLDGTDYRIEVINDTMISAYAKNKSIQFVFGSEILSEIIKMKNKEIADSFGLDNESEINCSEKAIAFLAHSDDGETTQGNCVYE